MHKDCSEICMEQLWALSPWTSIGHQGMMQTRSMTRIAEEWGLLKQGGSLHGHLWALGPRTMMMMHYVWIGLFMYSFCEPGKGAKIIGQRASHLAWRTLFNIWPLWITAA